MTRTNAGAENHFEAAERATTESERYSRSCRLIFGLEYVYVDPGRRICFHWRGSLELNARAEGDVAAIGRLRKYCGME